MNIGLLQRFASELSELRERAGRPSFALLAARTHFSRSAMASVTAGHAMPTVPVLRAFVDACGGDSDHWEQRWHQIQQAMALAAGIPTAPSAAWPPEAVIDGADPDAAGCSDDAVVAHARRLASAARTVLGAVQLRYSPSCGAAWARFDGYGSLDHIANQRRIDIVVRTERRPDGAHVEFRTEYVFDWHWSDLLRTGRGSVCAVAAIVADGQTLAEGRTDWLALP
jgi:hypothetical protein